MHNRTVDVRGRSRFLPNTVALVVQTIFATLLTLAQVKILSNYLTKETFGLFVSLRGFSLLLSILASNGLPQLLLRFIPTHESHGERKQALRISLFAVGAATGLTVALGIVVYFLRQWFFAFAGGEVPDGALLYWFFIMTLAVALKMVIYGGLNGLRRLTAQMILESISLTCILVWVVLQRDHLTLLLLFQILGLVHLITLGIGLPFFFSALVRSTAPRPTAASSSPAEYGDAYRTYLVWAAAMSFVALAFSDVDRYLVAQVLSLEMLALFHIAARVSRLANRLLGVPNLAFQPEVTRLDAAVTSKSLTEIPVPATLITLILPSVAPAGTRARTCSSESTVKLAAGTALKSTSEASL